jgi:cobalamin biosynthesis Co2+ chelatase CbiK
MNNSGIIIAAHGSGCETAQLALENFKRLIEETFPYTPVRWLINGAPVQTVLDPMCSIQRIVVFPLYLSRGRKYGELAKALEKDNRICLLEPLLESDIGVFADIFSRELQAFDEDGIVLMGHGDRENNSNKLLRVLELKLKEYDDRIFLACLNGEPGIDKIVPELLSRGIKKVRLIPLTIVAGVHARHDMAGSWAKLLADNGIESKPVLKGLIEYDALSAWLLERLKNFL